MNPKPTRIPPIYSLLLLALPLFVLLLPTYSTYANEFSYNASRIIQLLDKLTGSDNSSFDQFGTSVSLSDDLLLVGAPRDNGDDFQTGTAYIFRRDAENWQEEAKLMASDGGQDDQFGFSLSLSGQIALVGAYRDDDQGDNSGAAYIYRREGESWQELQKLHASDGSTEDQFAYSVALHGDVALIGASNANNGTGAAYIFRWNGSSWAEEAILTAIDGTPNDHFAYSVALDGNVALIGANERDEQGRNSGAGYIYRFDGATWQQEHKLLANDGAAEDRFGNAVALRGNVALIGAHFDDEEADGAGSAYLFRWNGKTWQQEQKLTARDSIENANFGQSLSLTEHRALIGAPGANAESPQSGAAYLYQWNGNRWQQTQKLIARDGAKKEHLGYSVSLNEERAFIGAPDDDDNGASSGSAYPYHIPITFPLGGKIMLRHARLTHQGTHIRLEGAQGSSFETTTASDGRFTFDFLPPDSYQLSARHPHHLFYQTTVTLNRATTIARTTLCGGDMDQDGDIDTQDETLMSNGIIPDSNPAYDLSGDGRTDVADLIMLQQHLGKSAPAQCGF